jgi:cell division protein FtsA
MAARRGGTVAAIDIGTTKVCTLIGDLDPAGTLRVLGAGITPSRGMKRGTIDDMVEVTDAVRQSVEAAQASAGGIPVTNAHIGFAGVHIEERQNKGLTMLSNVNRPISQDDISRAIDGARTLNVTSNQEVVHVLPRYYVIDTTEQVSNPLGMHGHRLDVEAHLVIGQVASMQNLKRCVQQAGVTVDRLVLEQLASAEAVLDEEERRQGVIVADIGGGTTDILVMWNNAVYHTAVLPVGGDSVTADLVFGLQVPFPAAEEAKERYGHALPSFVAGDEAVELEAFGHEGRRTVNRRFIAEIVQARVEEILEMVRDDVRVTGYGDLVSAGVVLTGGAANLEGIERLATQVLQMPVRVAYPREVGGKTDIIMNPAYATSIGLLDWAARDRGLAPAGIEAQAPVRRTGDQPSGGLMQKLQAAMRAMLP